MIRLPEWKVKQIPSSKLRANLADILEDLSSAIRWEIVRRKTAAAGLVSDYDARTLVALEQVNGKILGSKMSSRSYSERNAINEALNWIHEHPTIGVERASIEEFKRELYDVLDGIAEGTRYEITRHGVVVAAVVTVGDLRCLDALARISPERLAGEGFKNANREERIAIAIVVGWQEMQERDDETLASWEKPDQDETDDDAR